MKPKQDKPSNEFWERSKELVAWCTPEELRILRIMAATELEKRLKQWDAKLEKVSEEAKARKTRAIRRNMNKVKRNAIQEN
jgi:hypothetical protein